MTKSSDTSLLVCLIVWLLLANVVTADNAALVKRGAWIEMGSDATNPLNTRWAKPQDIITSHRRPKGPIINQLQSGWITVHLPIPMNVERIGLIQGDYRNAFAVARDIEITSENGPTITTELKRAPGDMQWVDYVSKTDAITLRVKTIYEPARGKPAEHGSIIKVAIEVKEDLDKRFATPNDYRVGQTFVMSTPNQHDAGANVIGKPRKATEHPLTIWDQQDIDDLREQTRKYEAGRRALHGIVQFCEQAIANPMQVPEQKNDGINRKLWSQHNAVATGIANLGIGYALTGNEAYADEARRLLLRLADLYETWPVTGHPKMKNDKSKWSWQRLDDAIWLIPAAWGYDLIHNSQAMTEADREKIEQQFLLPCAWFIIRPGGSNNSPTNWSVIMNTAAMIVARVCDDQELYNITINGKKGDRQGGIYFHLDKGIDDDGMWAEGAIGYQFMAMRGLLVAAEILWRDGVDIYGYRDGRLKKIFDSPLWYAYPGGDSTPAIEDSNSASLFGRDAHLYQYAMRRYGDKTYNAILSRIGRSLTSTYNLFLPARDFAPIEAADLPRVPSIRFPGVGFAIARTGDGDQSRYLVLDHGPFRSHGHRDKLGFNLFALGQELFAEGGIAWYTTDIYRNYYTTTLAHNTISYNGQDQIPTSGRLEHFVQRGDLALIRATTDTAIPSTILDRTMMLSDGRLYDLFHVRSAIPFTFDLPYHARGELTTDLQTQPWAEHPADARGFAYFADPMMAATDSDWRATWSIDGGQVVMHAIGEPETSVVLAKTPKGSEELGVAMLRRDTQQTTFGAVIDLVEAGAKPSISGVRKIASNDQSYAIRTTLPNHGYEIAMASFDDEPHNFDGWQTDARSALVRIRDGRIDAAILAGGTELKGEVGKLIASKPGLICYRMLTDDLAEITNTGSDAVRVSLSGVDWADNAILMDVDGKPKQTIKVSKGQITTTIPAMSSLELRNGEQPTVAEYQAALRREKLLAALERERAELVTMKKQAEAQQQTAAEQVMPEDYFVLVQADTFTDQDGGKVSITDKKTATFGHAISGWNNRKHWLEYEFEVEHDGLYQIVFKYCREGGPTDRSMTINSTTPIAPAALMTFEGSGGWANGSDDWKLHTLMWPRIDMPALVKLPKGRHTLRLDSPAGGGLNIDYIVIASPSMEVTRDAVEQH